MTFCEDRRGQAVGVIEVIASIALVGILGLLVALLGDRILSKASAEATSQPATRANQWLQVGVDQFGIALLFVLFFGAVAYAAFQRRYAT